MKNLKKVLSFVIAFTMILGFAASASVFPDVADDASYAEAATILSSLGIMIGDDKGNFNPDNTITRAEVAAIVVRAKGLESASNGAKGATKFSDVAENHWATGYINLAAQSGIIAGYTDGTFRPEEPVTYEQVTKMIVAALGYTPKADNNGGYPTGYLVIASQEGIAKGATGQAGDPAKRAIVARLIFNALDVKLMEQTGFKVGEPEYKVVEKTLLTDYLKVDKYEGVISDTYLTKGTKADDDEIYINCSYLNNEKVIGTEIFAKGETSAETLFGNYVVAYAAEDEDTNDLTLLAVAAKSGKNNTVVVDYSQIEKVTLDADIVGKVEYFAKSTDGSTTKIDINAEDGLYYNGRVDTSDAVVGFLESPKPGSVKFIDNNNDDEYDMIIVTEYTTDAVVKEINTSANTLTDKTGNDINIDIDDEDIITRFYMADGTTAAFTDIQVNDILTIVESNDSKLVVVYISRNAVEGTVSEQRTGDTIDSLTDDSYSIGGKEYRIAINGGVFTTNVSVGDEGKFYLNVDNRIVYKEATVTKKIDNYAYLYDADITTGIGGAVVQMKFLTAKGEWKTLDLASKLTVYTDGVSASKNSYPKDSGETAITIGDATAPLYTVTKADSKYTMSNVTPQLFRFDVNGSGAINRLYVIDNSKANDDNVFSLDASKTGSYSANTKRIGSTYFLDDTIVFSVPAVDDVDFDEADIMLSKASSVFKDANEYTIGAYDIEDGYPTVVVAYGAKTIIDIETKLLVITKVSNATNANGTEITKIYGLQDGVEVSGITSEDGYNKADRTDAEYTAALKAGDVVIFNTDAKGEIDQVRVLMSVAEARELAEAGYATDKGFYYENAEDEFTADAFGFAAKKESGRLTLGKSATGEYLLDSDGNDFALSFGSATSNVKVYEVNLNRSTPSIQNFSFAKIEATNKVDKDGFWIYARMYDGAIVDVVAYRLTNAVD